MTVQEFKDRLCENLDVPVYHILAVPDAECPVLCWQELTQVTTYGDDAPVCNVTQCQVDYFTESEYDETPGQIELALLTMDVRWEFDGMTYDNDRAEWRYIWTVSFLGGGAVG